MSLVRLLAVGKSLVDLKASTCCYRMRPRNLLPKFVSPKNPFTARAEPLPAQVALDTGPRPGSIEMTAAEVAAAKLKETRRLPVAAAPVASSTTISRPAASAGVLSGIGGWWRKLNPFAGQLNHWPAARTAVPGPNKGPVQGELSLEKVRVVRNDLSDADVEIILVKNPGESRGKQTTATAEAASRGCGV